MYFYVLEYIKSYQFLYNIPYTFTVCNLLCVEQQRFFSGGPMCNCDFKTHMTHNWCQAYRDITNRKPINAQRDTTWHDLTRHTRLRKRLRKSLLSPGHPPVSHGQYTANPSIQLERNRQSVHTASPYPNALLQQPQEKMRGSECLESEICLLKKNRLPGLKLQLSNVLIIHRS